MSHPNPQKAEPAVTDPTEGIYSVEVILDRKKVSGRWKYYLKWLGYDERTWEDETNLIGCEELIREFEERQRVKTPKKAGEKRLLSSQKDLSPTTSPSPKTKKVTQLRTQPSDAKAQSTNDTTAIPEEYAPFIKMVSESDFTFEHEPEEVVAGCMRDGRLYLAVKFVGIHDSATFYPAQSLYKMIPQLVFAFYESKMQFYDPSSKPS